MSNAGHTDDSWPPVPPLSTRFAALRDALVDAVGFVHIGTDSDLQYLTQTTPTQPVGIICLPTSEGIHAIYSVSPTDRSAAERFVERDFSSDALTLNREIATRSPQTPTGTHVVSVLAAELGEAAGSGTLRVPPDIPHDSALRLEAAGYELSSTTALSTARATKTAAEHDCCLATQRAAVAAMARAETVLAASSSAGGRLRFNSDPLTVGHLSRQLNSALAACGVDPAGQTQITLSSASAGSSEPTQSTHDPTATLPADSPIQLTVSPRGPHGYHAFLTRTLVVDSDGGWERRAAVAAEAGIDAAIHHAAPGVDCSVVASEATAELGAYGFAVSGEDSQATASVHGVGLSPVEPPLAGTNSQLQVGSIVAIETAVTDSTHGTVRLGTLCVVTDDDTAQLVSAPQSVTPTARDPVSDLLSAF